jgi:hypothetical protein
MLARMMAQSMGERLGTGMRESAATTKAALRQRAADAKPPAKHPHSFDADAAWTFDDFAAHAETLGLESLVDELTDSIARGKLTEVQAYSQLWPSVAHATRAGDQYTFEHPWRTREPHMNDAMARYDELGKFSLARALEVLVNPRWEALKDRGNDALKAGEPGVAIIWYKRAESLTDSNNAATAFFKVVGGLGGAGARLADAEVDLRDALLRFLPDGPRAIVPFDAEAVRRASTLGEPSEGSEPNLPRAICLSNTAAAWRKAGKHQAALDAALDAVAFCPEYIKGHHRLVQCWRAVGKESEAAELEMQLGLLATMRQRMAWMGGNMLCFGWVGALAYEQIYGPAYFRHECQKVAELKKRVTVLASIGARVGIAACGVCDGTRCCGRHAEAVRPPSRTIALLIVGCSSASRVCWAVPVGGGQWLTVGVEYRSVGASLMEGGPPERRHDMMHMAMLDSENGDIVQLPPHGRASKASVEAFPPALFGFLRQLREHGIEPEHLCLGQGLTVFERSMKKRLKKAGFCEMTTNASTVTHASKVEQMGEAAACGL